jgi:hypothetical protein
MPTRMCHRSLVFAAAVFAFAVVGIYLITPRISYAQTNGKTASEIHMCSLLSEADVSPIVGAHQIAQETKGGATCMWGDPGNDPNKPRLLIQAPSFSSDVNDPRGGPTTTSRDRLESSFKANRKQAFDDKNAHAKDEPHLARYAFSALTDDGAEIMILKNSNVLNIRFVTGNHGTPENIEAIRKVAAKVAASF